MVGGTKLKVHSASLTATDPLLLTPVSAIKRGAQKGVFWGPTRIKTDYQLATSILGYLTPGTTSELGNWLEQKLH